ncbi:hypothetical protein ACIQ9P_21800 [Kitasatospora sp. NPDC094019]|uniref:hypothetical protein n=1 Tax=Kitasatospora sp. NPDC094019 TaxID=3364091 RepID=UPI00381DF143
MFIGKKLTATLALLGAMAAGGVVAAAPAGAAPSAVTSQAGLTSVGIRLSTGHGVGVYGYYNVGSAKVAADLSPASHDGIDVDCWSDWGQDIGSGSLWYHTYREYHNDAGWQQSVYGWTYAAYVDYGAAKSRLPFCGY